MPGALSGFLTVLAAMFFTSCGGSSSSPLRHVFELTPSITSIHVTASTRFQVAAIGRTVQEWTVNGIPGGNAQVGTINAQGVYKAPGIPPVPNTVVVAAIGVDFTASTDISVVNPVPTITSISPELAMQGAPSLSLTVTGSGFSAQSRVIADGVTTTTKVTSATSLQATVPAKMLSTPGAHTVVVQTPLPGGGATASLTLTVVAPGTVRASSHPLVALYDIEAPRDAEVTVEFGLTTEYGRSTSAFRAPAGGGSVEVQVAGMLASTAYHMRAHLKFADGTTLLDQDHTFTTGTIPPERLPKITITRFAGMTPSPGIELLDFIFPAPGTNPLQASAVDLDGHPIWYYDAEPGATVIPLKLLPSGHFLLFINYPNHLNDSLREIDLVGNTIRDLKRADLNQVLVARFGISVDQFHHDVLPLPNGHFILLCNVTKQIDGLVGYSSATKVQGDILVDLDANWQPAWAWSAFDHLDPNRHLQGLPDWTHGNAIAYTANDGNLLLSVRHQSWILKIDYANGTGSGAVLWRFGDEGDFTLTSGDRSAWQYGQHYPRVISITGSKMRLLVMDNGNLRMDANGVPCGGKSGTACYSRLPIFDLDELSRTVTPVWEYRPGFYSQWGGSAEILANGDVEGAFSSATPGSQVLEVTGGDNPQPVWQLGVAGESAYRGFRMPSLYPGVQW